MSDSVVSRLRSFLLHTYLIGIVVSRLPLPLAGRDVSRQTNSLFGADFTLNSSLSELLVSTSRSVPTPQPFLPRVGALIGSLPGLLPHPQL